MAIDLDTVMTEIGAAINGLGGLRIFDFPPLSAQPPFAFVDFPDELDYDTTMGRGFDRMTIRLFVAVSAQVDRAARNALIAYGAGSGPNSIKAAIENAQVGSSVRVTKVTFGPLLLSSGNFAGAMFTIDVLA